MQSAGDILISDNVYYCKRLLHIIILLFQRTFLMFVFSFFVGISVFKKYICEIVYYMFFKI